MSDKPLHEHSDKEILEGFRTVRAMCGNRINSGENEGTYCTKAKGHEPPCEPVPLELEGERKVRLEEAQKARDEFDEHFYDAPDYKESNDPTGLRECLDARINALRGK